MRVALGLVMSVAACGPNALKLHDDACDKGDAEACLASAQARWAAKDSDGAQSYLEKQIALVEADTNCLPAHGAVACFHGVVAILREPAAGMLLPYAIDPELVKVLGPWTGADADGPRAHARRVLERMCNGAGEPIDKQRACLVLGDIVTLERTRRVAGYDDATDGYAAACNLKAPDPAIVTTYGVDACGVAASERRGASLHDGVEQIARITHDAAQHDAADADAQKREAARIAEMKRQAAERTAAAAKEAAAQSAKQIAAATTAEDWDLLLETLRARPGMGPLDDATAATLAKGWDAFSSWLVAQSSPLGAQLELARDLHDVFAALPPTSPLSVAAAPLRTRAVADARALAKKAGGPGGRFVHAALIALASGDKADLTAASTAFDALQKAVRTTLVLDKLPAACAALAKTPAPPGQPLHVTAALTCTIEPEHVWKVREEYMVNNVKTPTDVEHRGYKLVVHGTVGEQPVDFEDIVDETTDKLERSFTAQLATLVDALWKQLVSPIEAKTAADALAAGKLALQQKNTKRATNELAIHAVLAGASEELDALLAPYHVTFGQLVPGS